VGGRKTTVTHSKRIDKGRVSEAEEIGIKSVPALVLDGQVFHINFGAGLSDLK